MRLRARLALAALTLAACREEPARPAAPARLSVAEAQAGLEAREAREAARAPERAPGAAAAPAGPAEEGPRLTLGARLLDAEARPLPGAELAWLAPTESDWQAVRARARADGSGAVWLALPRAAAELEPELRLVASAEGTLRRLVRLPRAQVTGEALINLGELLLAPGGAVRGRVLDEWGGPLAGVGVGLGPELEALGGDPAEVRALAAAFPLLVDLAPDVAPPIVLSAPDGSYALTGVPVGRFMVVAAAVPSAERVLVPARVEGVLVEAGQATAVPDLVLRAARAEELVRGRVLAVDGSPLAGAAVSLERAGASYAGGRTTSDEAGRFALLAPPGLDFELRAHHARGHQGEGRLQGVRAGAPDLELRLAPR